MCYLHFSEPPHPPTGPPSLLPPSYPQTKHHVRLLALDSSPGLVWGLYALAACVKCVAGGCCRKRARRNLISPPSPPIPFLQPKWASPKEGYCIYQHAGGSNGTIDEARLSHMPIASLGPFCMVEVT